LLPWTFVPQQKFVDVLPGETSLAFYRAKNEGNQDVIGIATYNVTPDRVGHTSIFPVLCGKILIIPWLAGSAIFLKGGVFLL
jgi:hypothetical protein